MARTVPVTWEEHKNRNCWWDGHGAEEVDTPKGTAVARAKTLKASKEACVEASQEPGKPFCDGVIFKEHQRALNERIRMHGGITGKPARSAAPSTLPYRDEDVI